MSNEIRKHLVEFVKGANKVASEQAALAEKRVGTYTRMVMAGIASKNADTFLKECEAFADELRANTGGIARKLGCTPAKRQPKDQPKNKPVYTVPSSFMAAKSYVKSAYEFGVNLDEDGEPRTYTAIRKDVDVLKAEAAKNALTGDDAIRVELVEALAGIQSRVEQAEGDNLSALRAIIITAQADCRKAFGIDQMREQKAASKAADTDESADEVNATPKAIELASEHDIDIAEIEGTGKDGRVTVGDVRALVEADELAQAA